MSKVYAVQTALAKASQDGTVGAGGRPTPPATRTRHFFDKIDLTGRVSGDEILLGPFPKGAQPLTHEASVHVFGTNALLRGSLGYESLDGQVSDPTKYGTITELDGAANSGRSGDHVGDPGVFPDKGYLKITLTQDAAIGSGGSVPPTADSSFAYFDVPWVGA